MAVTLSDIDRDPQFNDNTHNLRQICQELNEKNRKNQDVSAHPQRTGIEYY